MNRKKLFVTPIADLALTSNSRNAWVFRLKTHKVPEFLFGWGASRIRLCKEFSFQFTVQDVVDCFNEEKRAGHKRGWSWFDGNELGGEMVFALRNLGLTSLDWAAIPGATTEQLKRAGKKLVRQQSVLLLSTLSSKAIRNLERLLNKLALDISVENLLGVSRRAWERHDSSNFGKSILKTWALLREVGFGYDDGVFLQDGTKRQFVESLQIKEGLPQRIAIRVAEIAQRRGWVAGFKE